MILPALRRTEEQGRHLLSAVATSTKLPVMSTKSKARSKRINSESMLSLEPRQVSEELYTPSHSTNISDASYGDTAVRCNSVLQSEEVRLIEIPYICEIQTILIPGVDLLTRMERFVLSALAEGMLSCYNEQIRRSLSVTAEQYYSVVAAYLSSDSVISNQRESPLVLAFFSLVRQSHYVMPIFALDTCSISNTHICTVIEGTIDLAVDGGSTSEDRIADEALTTLRLAFRALDDPDILSVNYMGNDSTTVSLIDQYSQRGDIDTTHDESEYSLNFLLLSIVCSLFSGVVIVVIFLSIGDDRGGDDNSMGDTCSVSIASSYDDEMSELGCDPPPPPKP